MGLCIFSDASSVNRVLSLKPLFILRREVRMSATPWPDVPEFAMLGSIEASSCSSSLLFWLIAVIIALPGLIPLDLVEAAFFIF